MDIKISKGLSVVAKIAVVVLLVVLAGVIYMFNTSVEGINAVIDSSGNLSMADYNKAKLAAYDGTYIVNGESIELISGLSELEIDSNPDTSTRTPASTRITRYFGNDAKGDLDGDGSEDVAFIITQQTGGTGTFYYVTALLNTADGKVGTEAVPIGDRIAPQSTSIEGGILSVNYMDRKDGESMATDPSVAKSLYLKLNVKTLKFSLASAPVVKKVAENPEGEADPSRMTLGMKTWSWISTKYNDGTEVKPSLEGGFALSFSNGQHFILNTDCNSIGGDYTLSGKNISFTATVTTNKFCATSQESEYAGMIGQAQSYTFTSRGELVFDLKSSGEHGSGKMTFR